MQCVDSNGCQINPNVVMYTICRYCTETFQYNTIVYSITQCVGKVRSSHYLFMTEMNSNINSHNFLQKILENYWQFDQIFVDHFLISEPYLVQMLGPVFLKNATKMTFSPILSHKVSQPLCIYLLFTAHTFVNIHCYKKYLINTIFIIWKRMN